MNLSLFFVGAGLLLTTFQNCSGAGLTAVDTLASNRPLDGWPDIGSNPQMPQFPDNPVPANVAIETIASNHQFTEGPVWVALLNSLLFSDIPREIVYRWDAGTGQVSVLRENSSRANGHILDLNGFLITGTAFPRRAVIRTDLLTGESFELASRFQNARFNAPNDLAVFQDNSIFFTDPTYNTPAGQLELNFSGVFRIRPTGQVDLVSSDFSAPNGIVFSPGFDKLYVSDSEQDHIRSFDVDDQGAVTGGEVFYDPKVVSGPNNGSGSVDGLTMDMAGNLYTSGRRGVTVLSPSGQVKTFIDVGEQTTNVSFGGPDNRTLFVTCPTTVRRLQLLIPGAR